MHRACLLVLLALPAAWACAHTYTHRRGMAEVGLRTVLFALTLGGRPSGRLCLKGQPALAHAGPCRTAVPQIPRNRVGRFNVVVMDMPERRVHQSRLRVPAAAAASQRVAAAAAAATARSDCQA